MRLLLSLLLLLYSVSFLSAQPPRGGGDGDFSRIRAAAKIYLTERMDLTQQESDAFFPLYFRFEREAMQLKYKNRPRAIDLADLSETAAAGHLDKQAARDREEYELKVRALQEYRKVLPAKKLVLLDQAQAEFRRKLIRRLRD